MFPSAVDSAASIYRLAPKWWSIIHALHTVLMHLLYLWDWQAISSAAPH